MDAVTQLSASSLPPGRRHRFPVLVQFLALGLIQVLALLLLVGCQGDSTPLAGVTPWPSATTASPTANPTASPSPSPSATAVPSHTPTRMPTPTPTPTPLSGAHLLAFESYRDGNGEIYLLDTSSSQLTNLTRNPADDCAPAWSPDGSAIAFESNRDGNWEIYVLDLADGSVKRLTDELAYDGAPVWSPDGSQIAYESYRDGNLEIYAVVLASGETRRLTEDPSGDYAPAWSPDGSAIAFTSWRDGNKEIYVMPIVGGEPRNLSQQPADDEEPAWAPDGSAIAFVSWHDVDPQTGNRNAEIYRLSLADDSIERVTDTPWPDLDPAWDFEGRLVWATYDAGPPFETYDPRRPGDYHVYRAGTDGAERLTAGNWDDRHPAPAPPQVASLDRLVSLLPTEPLSPTPMPTLAPGALVPVVEVPSILVGYSGQPIQVNGLVAPSLVAWQQDMVRASGWDFMVNTLGTWRNIDQVRRRKLYAYDYGYLSWHKAGRALDLALEYKIDGADQMVLVREDLGENVYWRMYLRTAQQDGTQGEPLRDNPWLFWWHIVPEAEPEAYAAGGRRLPIPAGYYVDVTAIAKRHGWERIACYAIDGDYHWQTDSNGTEYWHYERTDGLLWWDAMRQIYASDALEEHVGWQAGLQLLQSEEMMRSKGIPTPMP